MSFRKYRRVRTGKYSWRNYGKMGFSTTTKYGSRTITRGPKGLKSTYHYADGLSQTSHIGTGSTRRRVSNGAGGAGIGAGGIGFLLALWFFATYPLVTILVVAALVVAIVIWLLAHKDRKRGAVWKGDEKRRSGRKKSGLEAERSQSSQEEDPVLDYLRLEQPWMVRLFRKIEIESSKESSSIFQTVAQA